RLTDAFEILSVASTGTRQLVFCGADLEDTLSFLNSIRNFQGNLFVVAVTRRFDLKSWLDLLEAGAADYCLFPVDEEQIQWPTTFVPSIPCTLKSGDWRLLGIFPPRLS